jgi:hypothetical protein
VPRCAAVRCIALHTIIVCNQRAASILTYAVNLVTHCCNVTLAEYGEACNASRRTAETTVPNRCGRIRCTSDNNTLQCGAVPVGFRRFGAALSVGQRMKTDRRRVSSFADSLLMPKGSALAEWAHPSLTWSTMRLSFQRDQPTDRSYSCLIEYSALLNRTNPYQDCGTPNNGWVVPAKDVRRCKLFRVIVHIGKVERCCQRHLPAAVP